MSKSIEKFDSTVLMCKVKYLMFKQEEDISSSDDIAISVEHFPKGEIFTIKIKDSAGDISSFGKGRYAELTRVEMEKLLSG